MPVWGKAPYFLKMRQAYGFDIWRVPWGEYTIESDVND